MAREDKDDQLQKRIYLDDMAYDMDDNFDGLEGGPETEGQLLSSIELTPIKKPKP